MLNAKVKYFFIAPTIVILAIIVLYPFFYGIFASFHHYERFSLDRFIGVDNYSMIFHSSRMWNSLIVTLTFTLSSVGISFAVGFAISIFIERSFANTKFAKYIIAGILFPMVMTPVVVGILWKIMFWQTYGPVNYYLASMGLPAKAWLTLGSTALPATIFVDIWEWTPFMTLVLYAGLMAVPREPVEAAMVDGASYLQTLKYIIIPFLKPIIVIALIIRFVEAFRWFDTIFVMTGGGPGINTETLSFYAYKVAFSHLHFGKAMAITTIMFFFTLIGSLIFVEFSGLSWEK